MSMEMDEEIEVVALVEMPGGLLEGRFQGRMHLPSCPGQSVIERALWGLLAGLLKHVPAGVPFALTVLSTGLMWTSQEDACWLLSAAGHPLCTNASTWTWTCISQNGKEVH